MERIILYGSEYGTSEAKAAAGGTRLRRCPYPSSKIPDLLAVRDFTLYNAFRARVRRKEDPAFRAASKTNGGIPCTMN